MLRLLCTICVTDHKGRPDHHITDLGTGTRPELVAKMDADVKTWQLDDLKTDLECDENCEGEVDVTTLDVANWEEEGERWEMEINRDSFLTPPIERIRNHTLREFAYDYDDGDHSSIVYHILELD